jgi:hypothetical protein
MSDNENPVLQPLSESMRCGIFSNSKGEVLIIYNYTLETTVQWLEFHVGDRSLSIIHETGKIQDLGIKIDNKMKKNIMKCQEVSMAQISDNKIQKTQKISLIIQNV